MMWKFKCRSFFEDLVGVVAPLLFVVLTLILYERLAVGRAHAFEAQKPLQVTSEIIVRLFPLIIEELEHDYKEFDELERTDDLFVNEPEKATLEKKKVKMKFKKERELRLKMHGITMKKLEKWKIPIVSSSLLTEYFAEHVDMKKRFLKMVKTVPSCNEDPYQRGCKKLLEQCREVFVLPSCENVKKEE